MSEDDAPELRRLLVKDIMVKDPITVYSETTVREAALVMERSAVGCVLVTRDERERKVVGIVTERDLVRRVLTREGDLSGTNVQSIMSSPLIVIGSDATIEEAARIMERNNVRRLPVVDQAGCLPLTIWRKPWRNNWSTLTQSSMPWQG